MSRLTRMTLYRFLSAQAFVNDVYSLFLTKEMLPPSYYFNLSWQVFTLLMMTGNLYDYALVP